MICKHGSDFLVHDVQLCFTISYIIWLNIIFSRKAVMIKNEIMYHDVLYVLYVLSLKSEGENTYVIWEQPMMPNGTPIISGRFPLRPPHLPQASLVESEAAHEVQLDQEQPRCLEFSRGIFGGWVSNGSKRGFQKGDWAFHHTCHGYLPGSDDSETDRLQWPLETIAFVRDLHFFLDHLRGV